MLRHILLFAVAALSLPVLLAQGSPPVFGYPDMGVDEYESNQLVVNLSNNAPAATGRAFGAWQVGSAMPAVTIRVSNGPFGGTSLNTLWPTLSGSTADFVLDVSGYTPTIATNSYTSYTVAFAPSSPGAKSALVFFQYEADPINQPGVYSTFTVNFTGTGSATQVARLRVSEDTANGPRAFENQVATGSRLFGPRVITSGPTAARTYVLANIAPSGSPALSVSLPALVGTTDFVLDTAGFSTTLAPGASTSFTVAFDPAGMGTSWGALVLTHSDASEVSPFTLNFSGEGALQATALRVSDGAPPFFAGPPTSGGFPAGYIGSSLAENEPAAGPRDMGSVAIGNSKPLMISVCHAGMGTMDISGFYTPSADIALTLPTISGDPEFTLETAGYAATIGEAVRTTFIVRFTPTSQGPRTAVITLGHDDNSERTPFRVIVMAAGGAIGSGGKNGGNGEDAACSAGENSNGHAALIFASLAALLLGLRVRRTA